MPIDGDSKAVLYIFSGLPGVGKTTLARTLAKHAGAMHLRIDTIEQALRDLCHVVVQGEGYRLAYRIAADNLRLGISVVADSCNPINTTRNEWEAVASATGARFVNIELICSNVAQHKRRVENRRSDICGLKLPTWEEIDSREFHAWNTSRVVLDTADRSPEESIDELVRKVGGATGRT